MTTSIKAVQAELAAAREQIQELQQHVHVFTQILDVVPVMILYKGPQSRIRFANAAFRSYYGMTAEQLQGIIDAPFNEPDYTQQYIIDDTHVFTTGQTLDIPQEPVTRFDGEVHEFHTIKNPIYDEQGTIIGTIGISEDITAQSQIQAALRQSEARAQRLIANIPGMVYQFVLQPDGTMRFPYVSNGSRDIFGLEPEAIEADAMTLIDTIHPDDRAGFEESVMESAKTLNPWTWEGRMKRHTAEIWAQGFSRPITHPNGDILWDGVVMDITPRKSAEILHQRLEATLAEQEQQLQAQIIKMHATALAELSTPLIVLNETTVLMPLIGSLDTQRTNQVMETLLNGITTNRALFAIVDLTGVPVVDTQVAMALIRVAQSVQLLGAQVIITGIRPEIAQTLVSLGIDLRGIVTQSDLQMGIRYAMASR